MILSAFESQSAPQIASKTPIVAGFSDEILRWYQSEPPMFLTRSCSSCFLRSRSNHFRSTQPSDCATGFSRTGTSCAISSMPSGSIHRPSTGRMLNTPPSMSSSASGIRTNFEDGRRSQLTYFAGPGGSLVSNHAKCRSISALWSMLGLLLKGFLTARMRNTSCFRTR
jgi:hypothetical protein